MYVFTRTPIWSQGFFSALVGPFVAHMGDAFPELVTHEEKIRSIIKDEEDSFSRTLEKGLAKFRSMAEAVVGNGGKQLAGPDAFLLWDTFGFPYDLTELMAEERGLTVDKDGFDAALAAAKELSRNAQKKGDRPTLKFQAEATGWLSNHSIPTTADEYKYQQPGYAPTPVTAKVLALLTPEGFVDEVRKGRRAEDKGDNETCEEEEGGCWCTTLYSKRLPPCTHLTISLSLSLFITHTHTQTQTHTHLRPSSCFISHLCPRRP